MSKNVEKALMSKKKDELVEIIIRKDQDEVNLKNQVSVKQSKIAELEKSLKKAGDDLLSANHSIEVANSKYVKLDAVHTELMTNFDRTKNLLNVQRGVSIVMAVAAIALAVILIL